MQALKRVTDKLRAFMAACGKTLGMGALNQPEPDSPDKIIVGRRLRLTRESLDGEYTQTEFAELLGINHATYSNWENGVALVPPWFVQRLKRLFQISHDWIYGGDLSGLRAPLRDKILPKLERLGTSS